MGTYNLVRAVNEAMVAGKPVVFSGTEADLDAVQSAVREVIMDSREPRVTYKPDPKKTGIRFEPDGQGGGVVVRTMTVHRKGFRPKLVEQRIRKFALGAASGVVKAG